MKFHEVIKTLFPKPNPEIPLSRLYGYQRDAKGKMQIVAEEGKIITAVITALSSHTTKATDSILNDLLQELLLNNIRNRSGKNWTKQTLLSLIRPIYAGVAVSKMGVWKTSKIYPPIVSASQVKTALRRLKMQKAA